jgi:predicted flap endonuclease-1-like 5' DNA nuclease
MGTKEGTITMSPRLDRTKQRAASIAELRNALQMQRETHRAEQAERAIAIRQRLAADVEALRNETIHMLQAYETTRQHESAMMQEQRAQELAVLRADTATQLHEYRSRREEQAATLHDELTQVVAHIQKETQIALSRATMARRAMATSQARRLQAQVAELRAEVHGILREYHQEWVVIGETQHSMANTMASVAPIEATPAASEPVPEAKPASKAGSRDDLTIIWGIGPAIQQRLYSAGITTFAQLATRSPEEVRRSLRDGGRVNHSYIDQWIDQARDLAGLR